MSDAPLTMNAATLRAQIRALGLTQTDTAAICDVVDRTVRNWCLGTNTAPPHAVAAILAAVRAADEAVDGLTPPADADPVVVTVYRTSEDMWAARPERSPYPATWWDVVAARVQNLAGPGRVALAYPEGSTP